MFLALTFFLFVFTTILWICIAVKQLSLAMANVSLATLSITDLALYAGITILPVFCLWAVFAFINQFFANRNVHRNIQKMLVQQKKSTDQTELLARILLENEKQTQHSSMIGLFDVFVSDINEALADIMYTANLLSREQIEQLWIKNKNGGRWAFGKVFLSVYNNQPNFSVRMLEKASNDNMLSGPILEFCARYMSFLEMLEKHDTQRVLLPMIETGVFGKVFSIFAPIADKLRQIRALAAEIEEKEESDKESFMPVKNLQSTPKTSRQKNHNSFGGFSLFKKKEKKEEVFQKKEPEFEEKDAFSIALEKNMAEEMNAEQIESMTEENLSQTQKTINEMQKEWEDFKRAEQKSASENNVDDDFAHPFAGWTDEENYSK